MCEARVYRDILEQANEHTKTKTKKKKKKKNDQAYLTDAAEASVR